MTIFQSIILGVLQGIAEFLPISSSGHLKVAQELFGLSEVPLLFDVMLHLATLAAVILYFRKKIARLFVILFRWIFTSGKRKTENGKMEVERGKLELENEVGKAGSGTAFTETRSKPVSQVLPPQAGSLPISTFHNILKSRKKEILFKTKKVGSSLLSPISEYHRRRGA